MNCLTGDDDIPYRERKRDQEERLRREVAKSRGKGGDDLNMDMDMDNEPIQVNNDTGSGKRKRNKNSDANDEESADGYYELVKRAKKEKEESKKREYDENRMAERFELALFLSKLVLTFSAALLRRRTLGVHHDH